MNDRFGKQIVDLSEPLGRAWDHGVCHGHSTMKACPSEVELVTRGVATPSYIFATPPLRG